MVGRLATIQGLYHINATSKKAEGESLLQKMQVDRREVLFVGDTRHDLEVAQHLGLNAMILAHGHQEQNERLPGATNICSDLWELREPLPVKYQLPLAEAPQGARQ